MMPSNITLQGRASEYDRIVDILRSGIGKHTADAGESCKRFGDARLKKLSETKATGGEIADQSIASRLLVHFPMANPVGGHAESLKRVERADLMLRGTGSLSPN